MPSAPYPSLIPRGRFLLAVTKFPVRCRREFTLEVAGWWAQPTPSACQGVSDSSKFPVFFPVSRETRRGETGSQTTAYSASLTAPKSLRRVRSTRETATMAMPRATGSALQRATEILNLLSQGDLSPNLRTAPTQCGSRKMLFRFDFCWRDLRTFRKHIRRCGSDGARLEQQARRGCCGGFEVICKLG